MFRLVTRSRIEFRQAAQWADYSLLVEAFLSTLSMSSFSYFVFLIRRARFQSQSLGRRFFTKYLRESASHSPQNRTMAEAGALIGPMRTHESYWVRNHITINKPQGRVFTSTAWWDENDCNREHIVNLIPSNNILLYLQCSS